MKEKIQFYSALTLEPSADLAVDQLVEQVEAQREGGSGEAGLDLALVFISAHFMYEARRVVDRLREKLKPGVLLGCTAEGVIGREREIEGKAAITLVAARMPGVQLTPFSLQPQDWPKQLLDPDEFRRAVAAPDQVKMFILLGDPFSTPMEDVLQAFRSVYPGVPICGGMASGALRPNGNALFLNEHITNVGTLGMGLSGEFEVDITVSQGCRPIWRPFKITAAQKNVIYSLEGQPPLAWIQDLIPELSEEDRALMQNGLFVGRAIRQHENLGRGDFLIRGVVGIDRQNGSIAIGDAVVEGEIVQFHLRDALTAKEDLDMMLIPQTFRDPPHGALLFSCNGRGMKLYDHPNGDITVIQKNLGGTHLAGFFCAGEIGPIGGENYLHGHTASLAVFRS